MARRIPNLPQLTAPDGSPFTLRVAAAQDGAPVSLARWITDAVGRVPMHRLGIVDHARIYRVMQLCTDAEKSGVIELDDDVYVWLKTLLFDDERGKQLFPAEPANPMTGFAGSPGVQGAMAPSIMGLVGIAIMNAMEAMQPVVVTAAAVAVEREHAEAKA